MSINLEMIRTRPLVSARTRIHKQTNSKSDARHRWVALWNPYPETVFEVIARLQPLCHSVLPTFTFPSVRIGFFLKVKQLHGFLAEYFDANCNLITASDELEQLKVPRSVDLQVRNWYAIWDPFPDTIHATVAELQRLYTKVTVVFISETAVKLSFVLDVFECAAVLQNRHFDSNCILTPQIIKTRKFDARLVGLRRKKKKRVDAFFG